MDYYLTLPPSEFSAKLPFTIKEANEVPEHAIDDLMPDKWYSKTEMLEYLNQSLKKCNYFINGLTAEKLGERFIEDLDTDDMDYPLLEILLYNLRHVQHHIGQLNLLLRQAIDKSSKWVFRAEDVL